MRFHESIIAGANGRTGWELVREVKVSRINYSALTNAQMDITDKHSLRQITSKICACLCN